ncbi:hypothetical protein KCP69_22790 [Salmonella enterica subsp. enterica]|nr:hypothetical protein KCP69_22790 [Salmonella enterica subsp. enterica]
MARCAAREGTDEPNTQAFISMRPAIIALSRRAKACPAGTYTGGRDGTGVLRS